MTDFKVIIKVPNDLITLKLEIFAKPEILKHNSYIGSIVQKLNKSE